MKTNPRLLLASLVIVTSPQLLAEPPVDATIPRILGDLLDGTPPPPEAAKHGFSVKPSNILTSKSHQQGGRTLTLGEIKPIALPAPFKPAPPSPAAPARLAAPSGNPLENDLLVLGATVFRLPDGTVRSLATLRIPGTTESATFLSTADFGLLAGLDSLLTADGKTRPIILAWSEEPCDSLATLIAQIQLSHGLKSLTKLAPGPATFTLITGRPPAATLTALQSLHRLYQSEQPRLLAAHQARERTRLAVLKSPPPPPKNLVLHHWNIGQSTPAPVTQGGPQ